MHSLSVIRVLFAFLAVQLALGLQISNAVADVRHVEADVTAVKAADPCPVHGTAVGKKSTGSQHDCCKSVGCQCQCASSPCAFSSVITRGAPFATVVRGCLQPRLETDLIDPHFRPPIAA